MKNSMTLEMIRPLTLQAETAAEMMSPNPVSIRDGASIQEAVALFTPRSADISMAPAFETPPKRRKRG